jgi:V8-like Glu-specific endopeptidase
MPDYYDPAEVVSPDKVRTATNGATAVAAADTAAAAAAIEEYWTEDRMRDARPVSLPLGDLDVIPKRLVEEMMTAASASKTAALTPDSTATIRVLPKPPDQPQAAAAAAAAATPVGNMGVYPYAVVGKLFMTFPFTVGRKDFVGSAWVVGERAVFTAGHCVYGENEARTQRAWATNLLFRAQYNGQNGTQVGSWPLVQKAALKEWINNGGWWGYDMGAGIAATPIRVTTGAAGYIVNQSPSTISPFRSIGYPAVNPFPGTTMYECAGALEVDNPTLMVFGMSNNMLGGCSGGPILTSSGGTQLVCGLNSFIDSGRPGVMHSPYFGAQFLRLLQWITDNGGD